MKSWLTLFVLFVLVSTLGYTQVTNKLDNLQVGTLTTKTIDVTSTVKASKPCPKMTLAERDAIVAPLEGQCVYNSTAKTLNLYDGSAWVEVAGGGEGGIANWQSAKFYDVDDVVIYSGNIYQCITQHTSGGSFDPSKFNILAQDLASSTGILDLSKGGTNKELIPSDQGVVFSDADSLEILPKGPNRSVLKIGDTGDLSFGDIDFSDLQGTLSDGQIDSPVSLSKGGTNKALTAQDKAIVYSDSDSLELLSPGTTGQVLKMGSTAPEWGNAGVSVSNNYATATELSKLTVPNEVLTEQATGEYYLEKNNNNILRDPSFEGGSYATIWSVNVSSDQFGTGAIDGGYTLRALPSSQIVEILQDSSLYVDAFADGSVQGMASARIKTSVSGVKLCPRKAAVTQTSLCVTHTGSGKWEHLKVPFILGDTSNGLVILTDSAVSGTIYVDDAFVGAVDLSATQSFDTTCDTVACQTKYTFTVGSGGVVSGDYFDIINGNAVVASTDQYTFNFNSGIFGTSPLVQVTVNDTFNGTCSSTGSQEIAGVVPSTTNLVIDFVCVSGTGTANVALESSFVVTVIKRDTDIAAALQAQKDYQKTKVSSYSSTNADTDWQACQFSTLAWQGLGTVTNSLKCKRQGSDLLINGLFTAGTTSAVEARIPLPTWNGSQLVVANSSIVTTKRSAGRVVRSTSNIDNDYVAMIEPSLNYFGIGIINKSTFNPFTLLNGSVILNSNEILSLELRIPIEGWENSNIIIGQFNGLEKCESTLDCTDTFSAKVSSAGVVSDENVDWINGNCTVTSNSNVCSFKSGIFTVTPNCWMANTNTGAVQNDTNGGQVSSLSINGATFSSANANGSLTVARNQTIYCQKQGVDYIGKTAKAVASDQNLRTPGLTNVKVCAIRAQSGTTTIFSQKGDCVTTATTSGTGLQTLNFATNYFTDTPICNCSVDAQSASGRICNNQVNGNTTISVATSLGSTNAGVNYIYNMICVGQ